MAYIGKVVGSVTYLTSLFLKMGIFPGFWKYFGQKAPGGPLYSPSTLRVLETFLTCKCKTGSILGAGEPLGPNLGPKTC